MESYDNPELATNLSFAPLPERFQNQVIEILTDASSSHMAEAESKIGYIYNGKRDYLTTDSLTGERGRYGRENDDLVIQMTVRIPQNSLKSLDTVNAIRDEINAELKTAERKRLTEELQKAENIASAARKALEEL